METLTVRARAAKPIKPAHCKPVTPVAAPKLSPETEKIVRLARRLKGAFGSTE